MSHFHAVIWMDHREAKVFHFNPTEVDKSVVKPDHPAKHVHHKAGSMGSGHATDDQGFLQSVAESVADAGAVLVVGPGEAKNEFVAHVEKHDQKLKKLIAGVETVDHPSDGQVVALARKYFKIEDRKEPQ